ncbi:MAG TPA: hypothetical protein VM779_02975 [Thermoanaerobaculia bacterium]|nr:hypothetical protein [Thermoanaerobaculia bacterium]
MNRKQLVSVAVMALLALGVLATTACKSGGMAVTSRGQFLALNIEHPRDLPERGEDNLDVVLGNRGLNNIRNIFVEVELPSQLVVMDQTNGRGITVSRDPGSNVYRFTIGNLQPTENTTLRFRVRTAFGTTKETEELRVTAWQTDLPGEKLVETAQIRLRQS